MRVFFLISIICVPIYIIISYFEFDDMLYSKFNQTLNKLYNIEPGVELYDYRVKVDAKELKFIKKNLSGLTYNKNTKTLFAITNSPRNIYELDLSANLLRTIKLSGFKDTEAIVYLRDNFFAIADELKKVIYILEITKDTNKINIKDSYRKIKIDLDTFKNLGFEGLAYNSKKDELYIVNEKLPLQIIRITGWFEKSENMSISFDDKLIKLDNFSDDFSGLHFDLKSNNLLFLSEESKLISEVNLNGEHISFIDLEKGFMNLKSDIPQAEGITMDEKGTLYIVSEPNLFYSFEK